MLLTTMTLALIAVVDNSTASGKRERRRRFVVSAEEVAAIDVGAIGECEQRVAILANLGSNDAAIRIPRRRIVRLKRELAYAL